MSINERVRMLVEQFAKGNKNRFATLTGLSATQVSTYMPPDPETPDRRVSVPTLDSINKILDALPEVSRDWLVSGEGSMMPMRVSNTNTNTNTLTAGGSSSSELEILREKVKSLERELARADEMIRFLTNKPNS
jgi:hypothetical protein